MISRNRLKIVVGAFYLETIALYFYYRPGLGDARLIIDGGKHIVQGINPYVGFDFGNSPIAGLVAYSIYLVIPDLILEILIPVLNATGYLLFVKYASERFNTDINPFLLLLPLLSPYRSLISAGQISGIVLLFATIFVYRNFQRKWLFTMQVFSGVLALELKPQVAAPLILAHLITTQNLKKLKTLVKIVIAIHISLVLVTGNFLEIKWLHSLLTRSENSLGDSPQVSMWKYLNYVIENPIIWRFISSLVFVVSISLIIAFRKKPVIVLVIASIAPLLLTYQHMYDLIPLILISLVSFTPSRKTLYYLSPLVVLYLNLPMNSGQIIIISLILLSINLQTRLNKRGLLLTAILILSIYFMRFLGDQVIEIQYSYMSFIYLAVTSLLIYSSVRSRTNVNS